MAKIDFTPIKGSIGHFSDYGLTFNIKVPIEHSQELKRRLTVVNNSSFFRMKQIMNSVSFLNLKITQCKNTSYSERLKNEVTKLLNEYKELQANQRREYFEEIEPGSFILPPGFWFMAETIKDNKHLNKDIQIKWLPETIRDYQKTAVEKLFTYKRATCVMATGLGKSIVIQALCKNFEIAGKRVCVVVPTEELVKQMTKTIECVCNTTSAGGGKNPKSGANVLVTTAASAIKYIDIYDAVIIDESHRSSAKTWENLLLAAINAEYVYNLTATPFRSDGMDLGIHAFGGPTIYNLDVVFGVKNGWLAKPEIFFVNIKPKNFNQDPFVIPPTKNAQVAYKILTQRPEVINFIIKNVKKVIAENKKCLILYKTVKAGQFLAKILKENGIHCGLASSNTKKVIQDFRDNKIRVMISNDKLVGEGVDIPDADILFNLIQNSSNTTTFQVSGRVLRMSPGKIKGTIIDVCIHGYSQFENAGEKRKAVYKKMCDNITVVMKG